MENLNKTQGNDTIIKVANIEFKFEKVSITIPFNTLKFT